MNVKEQTETEGHASEPSDCFSQQLQFCSCSTLFLKLTAECNHCSVNSMCGTVIADTFYFAVEFDSDTSRSSTYL